MDGWMDGWMDGRTDTQDEADNCFSQFCKCAKKNMYTYVSFPITQSFDVGGPLLSNPKISLLLFALNVLSVHAIDCRAVGSVRAAITDGTPQIPTVRHEQGLG
jgi:hypothetical protein